MRVAVTTMNEAVIKALVAVLVRKVGGVDAAAAIFGAHFGVDQKGTVSKIVSGQLRMPLVGVLALEDAAGEYPITKFMADRLSAVVPSGVELGELTARSVETVSHAHAQIVRALAASSDGGATITPREAGVIAAQLQRAILLAGQILAALDRGAK